MEKVYYGQRTTEDHAPEELNGKKLVFEEVLRAGRPQPTQNQAEAVLISIRGTHSKMSGWEEMDAWIERCPGGYVAVRHHAKYL